MNTSKYLTTLGVIVSLSLAAAPAAFAKGHAQGATDTPGENVGSETVSASQGEGAEQGNGKGAQGNLGESGSAGQPGSKK